MNLNIIRTTTITVFVQFSHFTAERRAQLQRSRSRQNVFQATPSGHDVVREINFDDAVDSPAPPPQPTRRTRVTTQKSSEESGESDAEALLARLRQL